MSYIRRILEEESDEERRTNDGECKCMCLSKVTKIVASSQCCQIYNQIVTSSSVTTLDPRHRSNVLQLEKTVAVNHSVCPSVGDVQKSGP